MNKDRLDFLKHLEIERNFSENTIVSYDNDLRCYEEFLILHEINYINVTKEQVRSYLKYLDSLGKKNSSISRNISSLRSFYNYLLLEERVSTNVFKRIQNPKNNRKLPNFLSELEMQDIFEAMPNNTALEKRNRLLLEMLYATGVRVSELLAIEINDINQSEKTIRIMGKGSKERIVFYGDYANDSLQLYLDTARLELVQDKTDLLFLSKRGNMMYPAEVKEIIDTSLKQANIHHKVSAHTFRHTFATHLLNHGADIKTVQELLGHENLSTTQIYTHVTSDRIKKEYLDKFPRD